MKVDERGRLVVPSEFRSKMGTDCFELREEGGGLVLTPVPDPLKTFTGRVSRARPLRDLGESAEEEAERTVREETGTPVLEADLLYAALDPKDDHHQVARKLLLLAKARSLVDVEIGSLVLHELELNLKAGNILIEESNVRRNCQILRRSKPGFVYVQLKCPPSYM